MQNFSYMGSFPFLRPCFLFLLLSFLSSCSTTPTSGVDRVLFENSTAKVGPLVIAEESTAELKQKEGNKSATSSNAYGTKPEAKKSDTQDSLKTGSLGGRVILLGLQNRQLDATGTMVTLTPVDPNQKNQKKSPQVHVIDMEDKVYLPRYSTISAGDQVVFVNKDNFRHNVFSSSGNNAFDLGTYGAGLKRSVTLEDPGIVKIYCNIHAEMATFIAVGSRGLSAKTDQEGRYHFDDLTPGKYTLTIWNIRGETKRTIEIVASEKQQLVDKIDTTVFQPESHKNKFGDEYNKNSKLFEDEFY